jgi:hypothetical protein
MVRTTSAADAFCIGTTSMSVLGFLVDAVDDAHHPIHVVGAIGEDQNIRRRVGGEMCLLRHQRPQNRH